MTRPLFAFCCMFALAGPAAAQAPRLAPPRLAAAPDARLTPFRAGARPPAPAAADRAPAPARVSTGLSPAAAAMPAAAMPAAASPGAPADRRASVPGLVAAGILGGGVGLFGGAFLGAWGGNFSCEDTGNPDECEAPVILGAVFGGVAGEALLLPMAEWLAGGRRGPLGKELLASVGLAGAGLALLAATHFDEPAAPVILVTVPLAQLAAVTALERH
ncbi:MAG TPA: hypothetical protein VFQ38_22395 [Longimicrobiales bacterium]|nr:hypothetical protein [Longimicrobiales bacterium]